MIAGQLQLDLEAAVRDEDDLHARIRAAVAEPGMSADEVDAAVADALADGVPGEALAARPCFCERPLLFAAELGEGSCGLCGRESRR